MNRRKALVALAAGSGALAVPAWIARAFAQSVPSDAPCETAGHGTASTSAHNGHHAPRVPGDIPSSLRRAERAGRPLLVLVIPEDERDRGDRGQAFGELINHGGDERLAMLATCEVVAGFMRDVRSAAPDVGAGEPLMVLIETDGSSLRTRRMDGSLPVVAGRESRDFEAIAREEDRIIDQRIEFLGDLLEGAVAPDAATVNRRAMQVRARLAAADLAAIDARLAARQLPTIAQTERAAGIVFAAARSRPADRAALTARLREAGNSRIRDQRVPGSRWAHSGGCGTTYEDEETLSGVGCGMGHIAARSQRFLDFFAGEENNANGTQGG